MRVKLLVLTVVAILGLFTVSALAGNKQPTASAPLSAPVTQEPTIDELFRLTNEERAKASVAPLVLDQRLNQSAQMKADELAREGWDDTPHISKDGKNGPKYIFEVYPECHHGSENLTQNTVVNSSVMAISAWIHSEPHRNALLNPIYDQVGFGINGQYIVQHFCDIP